MFTFAKMKNEHVTELSNTLFTRVLPEEGSLSLLESKFCNKVWSKFVHLLRYILHSQNIVQAHIVDYMIHELREVHVPKIMLNQSKCFRPFYTKVHTLEIVLENIHKYIFFKIRFFNCDTSITTYILSEGGNKTIIHAMYAVTKVLHCLPKKWLATTFSVLKLTFNSACKL